MKKTWLTCFIIVAITSLIRSQAPMCTPDTSILSTINVIHPSPFRDTVPGSGIQQPACIGENFALPFTVLVPNTFVFGGITLPLFSAQLDSIAPISGLPDGLSHQCFPADCKMVAGEPGCIIIHGTPTTQNDTGVYNLSIKFTIATAIGPLAALFPGSLFPGEYLLQLNQAGQCENTTSIKLPEDFIQTKLAPNPFSTSTTLSFWNTNQAKKATLNIHNMTGQIIRSSSVSLDSGFNQIQINRENLPAGFYLTTISAGSMQLVQRFVIND